MQNVPGSVLPGTCSLNDQVEGDVKTSNWDPGDMWLTILTQQVRLSIRWLHAFLCGDAKRGLSILRFDTVRDLVT